MAEIFDKPVPVEKVKKPRKKRAPLSDEQKKALVERLKAAREKKSAMKKKAAEPIKLDVVKQEEPKKEKKEPPPKVDNSYKLKQNEIQALRDELEIENLKHQLNESRSRSKKVDKTEEPKMEVVEEIETVIAVKNEPVIIPQKPPAPPKKIRASLAPKNIWNMF